MISKEIAKNVLNAALATGADFAEIYLEEVQTNSIAMDNGGVANLAYPSSKTRRGRVIGGGAT